MRCWWVVVGSIIAWVGADGVIVIICGIFDCKVGLIVRWITIIDGVCSITIIGAFYSCGIGPWCGIGIEVRFVGREW